MEKGWIEVYITAHDYKAEMAKEILESEGIDVVVMNQHDSAIQSIGNYYIYVAEKNVTKATELLKNLKH
jgi:predicted Fe-Mo cluster-binding NifX family protein